MVNSIELSKLKEILNSKEFKIAHACDSTICINELIEHIRHGYSVDGICTGLIEGTVNRDQWIQA